MEKIKKIIIWIGDEDVASGATGIFSFLAFLLLVYISSEGFDDLYFGTFIIGLTLVPILGFIIHLFEDEPKLNYVGYIACVPIILSIYSDVSLTYRTGLSVLFALALLLCIQYSIRRSKYFETGIYLVIFLIVQPVFTIFPTLVFAKMALLLAVIFLVAIISKVIVRNLFPSIDSDPAVILKLEHASLVFTKYSVGSKETFFSQFPILKRETLETIWSGTVEKLTNEEIINYDELSDAREVMNVDRIVSEKKTDLKSIYTYLLSGGISEDDELYDQRTLNIVRCEMAKNYVSQIKKELTPDAVSSDTEKKFFQKLSPRIQNATRISISSVGIFLLFFLSLGLFGQTQDGLTPVKSLAEQIYERSYTTVRIGAICGDGWESSATGRGACSHHGGVDRWLYGKERTKSLEECMEEAKKISWFGK